MTYFNDIERETQQLEMEERIDRRRRFETSDTRLMTANRRLHDIEIFEVRIRCESCGRLQSGVYHQAVDISAGDLGTWFWPTDSERYQAHYHDEPARRNQRTLDESEGPSQ